MDRDAVALRAKIKAGMDPIEAMVEVQQEAQERQAAEAPEGQPELAQPGINDPNAGGQMQAPAAPPSDASALAQMAAAMQQAPPQEEVPV